MKPFLLIVSLFLTFAAFGQADSGFTNKAEAKNLMVNGKKEGKWVEYLDDDKNGDSLIPANSINAPFYRLTVYKKGKQFGIVRTYYTGEVIMQEAHYINGKKNGVESNYDLGILMNEIPYKNDQIDGVVRYYYGGRVVSKETPYKNGKIDGVEMEYDSQGELVQETPYSNDSLNGVVRNYYSQGKLRYEKTYIHGKEVGFEKWYWENGNLRLEISYPDSGVGDTREYYMNGKLKRETSYPFGNVPDIKIYDSVGNRTN